MPPMVLVAYATYAGSTREVAERIAAGLRRRQLEVDVKSVDAVDDVTGYRAIVLGSAVHDGSWLVAALNFVDRFQHLLYPRAVWLFSVGSFGDTHAVLGALVKKQPRQIDDLKRTLRPRGCRLFAGVIDGGRWPWYGRALLWLFGARAGDNRDWPVIDRWADQVATECLQLSSAATPGITTPSVPAR
jgi:menaquinone-dependent protoporphyrinogen oxidase